MYFSTSSNVYLVVYFTRVHKVEDLQHHEGVKYESHVPRIEAQVFHDVLVIVVPVYFD